MSAIYDLTADAVVLNDLNHPIGLALSLIRSGQRVLELGCATGYTTRLLTQHLNCIVTGVEYMPEAAARARPFCEQLILGDVEAEEVLSQLVGPYDTILAGDILEHLRHPERILLRLKSTLRAGGSSGYFSAERRALERAQGIADGTFQLHRARHYGYNSPALVHAANAS